jgi:hypothetical protein
LGSRVNVCKLKNLGKGSWSHEDIYLLAVLSFFSDDLLELAVLFKGYLLGHDLLSFLFLVL